VDILTIVGNSLKLSKDWWKSQYITTCGEFHPNSSPRPHRWRWPCLNLPLDQGVWHRNFGDVSYYRDKMYKEQTNILLYILEDRRLIDQRYIGANFYTPYSHPAREKGMVIVGCGFSKSRRKFSNIFQQSVKIAVHHNLGEISPTPTFGGGGDPVLTFPRT
jgi:hypothetical protein